jgi:hypothetical protein
MRFDHDATTGHLTSDNLYGNFRTDEADITFINNGRYAHYQLPSQCMNLYREAEETSVNERRYGHPIARKTEHFYDTRSLYRVANINGKKLITF